MDAKSLIAAAHKSAQQLHDAVVEPASASGRQAYKVGGRIFAIVTEMPGGAMVTVKAAPVRGEILRKQYAAIVPGHHLNRRHWISITAGDGFTQELVDNEVRESYRLVQATLPSSGRAADGSRQRRLAPRQVQPFARKLAASMPGVSHGRPFVEKLDVYICFVHELGDIPEQKAGCEGGRNLGCHLRDLNHTLAESRQQ
jgi:predicted DNA-binding protein (MmcQ/YjbR family)